MLTHSNRTQITVTKKIKQGKESWEEVKGGLLQASQVFPLRTQYQYLVF